MDVIRRNSGHAQVIGNRDASTSTQSDEEKNYTHISYWREKAGPKSHKELLDNLRSNLDQYCEYYYFF